MVTDWPPTVPDGGFAYPGGRQSRFSIENRIMKPFLIVP